MLGLIAALIVSVLIIYGFSHTDIEEKQTWKKSVIVNTIMPVAENNKEIANDAKDIVTNS